MNKKKALKTVFGFAALGALAIATPQIMDYATSKGGVAAPARTQDNAPVTLLTAKSVEELKMPPRGEAAGLMLIGAQNAERFQTITDVRDLCAIVKSNALLNGAIEEKGDKRFSQEFESCADRTLHYEAGLIEAGRILGETNVRAISERDFCGIINVNAIRALMQYRKEAGLKNPDQAAIITNINAITEKDCNKGDFGIPEADWFNYVNKAVIEPFYGASAKTEAPAP